MPRITFEVPGYAPQPYRFPLDQPVLTVGRGAESDIFLDCGSVSGVHAEIRRVPGGFELRDLNSTNGITLDGYREEAISLRPGADVKLGDVILNYEYDAGEAEALLLEMGEVQPQQPIPAYNPPPVHSIPQPPPPRQREEVIYVEEASGNGWKLVFVIFLIGAFCTGLSLRFHKETGGSLVDAVRKHFFEPEVKPAPAPATAPPAAR
ncbi:MAG: FHA domain-containing protein [Luteolibacter sp.]